MSKGGSETSTVTSQQTLDPFIRDALQRNVMAAQQVSQLPYQPYSGPRVAGFRPAEQQAFDIAQQAVAGRVGSQQLAGATQAAQQAAAFGPEQFQQNVAGFMSPYQQNVIDTTMARLSKARAERDAATKAQLAASRAFGNTRRGVYEAQLAAEQDLNTAQTLANLYQQGYGQAAGLAAGLPGQRLQASQQLAALAPQALAQEQAYAGMLGGVGQQQRGMAQQNLDLAYRDFLEQRGYPVEQLRILQSGLQGLPAVTSTQQTSTQPGDGFLGGAANIVGILGGL
ncbi:MAG: hypothetical protein ACO3S3_12020, partial [Pseudohongiellaceae bacterium]